jgi:hypothetical protein
MPCIITILIIYYYYYFSSCLKFTCITVDKYVFHEFTSAYAWN